MFFLKSEEEKKPSFQPVGKLSEEDQERVLSRIEELVPSSGGGSWIEILDDEVAKLAETLSRTAVGTYYKQEFAEEEGHPRRWFFLLENDENQQPVASVSLCVLPEGVEARSNIGGTCHTTGYMNKNPYPDYAEDIAALASFIENPIPANWMQKPLPEYDATAPKP